MHIPPHNSPSPLPIKNPPSSITPTMMEAGTTTTTTSTSATTTTGDGFSPETPSSIVLKWTHTISRRFQHILDKTTPHILYRWITLISIALIYSLRVYMVQGFYIVSYGLGIYILNLLIAFLSPQVDPEIQQLTDGPTLPVLGSDEFRPFVRRLPEFKFCYSLTKAFCIAFVMTFFDVFDVPVFWPILLFYWVVLFTLTMRRQIHHMIKYRYVPFSFGKKRYDERRDAGEESAALVRD